MALSFFSITPSFSSSCLAPGRGVPMSPFKVSASSKFRIRCMATTQTHQTETSRRFANWKPNIWNHDFVQSLKSDYKGEAYVELANQMVEKIRHLFDEGNEEPLDQLQLIDDLQRLGVAYHFEREINKTLKNIESIYKNNEMEMDLYYTSLCFRLLRQHGYKISQDVFNKFKDENGDFLECLSMNIEGLLSLYEASYLALEEENVLDKARIFTIEHLKNKGHIENVSPNLEKRVSHALELPLHWRMPRLEARWNIETYERKEGMNSSLHELSKLDFNIIQAIHQSDIKEAALWWKNLGLGDKLMFTRDRMVESFLWALEVNFRQGFGELRNEIAQAIQLITSLDDIYDVYGTPHELELFTDAINRWDINSLEGLPEYIKIFFLALFNTVNETAYRVLKDKGLDILPYLKKMWSDLGKAQLMEAKWYHTGYTPSLEEYISNGKVSISGSVILTYSYFFVTQEITKEALETIQNYANIIKWSAIIFRLSDDLGTATDELERGDVQKCIQCYMKEASVSEEVARQHIKTVINDTWKKMNSDLFANKSPFERPFMECIMNLTRISQCMYLYGDGFGVPDRENKDRVLKCLIEPITF